MCFVKVTANALPSDGHADRDVQPCRTEFHSAVAERDRLGCFNVPVFELLLDQAPDCVKTPLVLCTIALLTRVKRVFFLSRSLVPPMGHIHGAHCHAVLLFPERLDDSIAEDTSVRFLEAFVDELDLVAGGFRRAVPAATGRPGSAPGDSLASVSLSGPLSPAFESPPGAGDAAPCRVDVAVKEAPQPDHKTIADFRKHNLVSLSAGLPHLHAVLQAAGPLLCCVSRRHRWQQVQSGPREGASLHTRQAQKAPGAGRRARRRLSQGPCPSRHPRRCGATRRCRRGQVTGEDCGTPATPASLWQVFRHSERPAARHTSPARLRSAVRCSWGRDAAPRSAPTGRRRSRRSPRASLPTTSPMRRAIATGCSPMALPATAVPRRPVRCRGGCRRLPRRGRADRV